MRVTVRWMLVVLSVFVAALLLIGWRASLDALNEPSDAAVTAGVMGLVIVVACAALWVTVARATWMKTVRGAKSE